MTDGTTDKNKTKKNKKNKKKPRKHWNEIQKPSAWYALGLKRPLLPEWPKMLTVQMEVVLHAIKKKILAEVATVHCNSLSFMSNQIYLLFH